MSEWQPIGSAPKDGTWIIGATFRKEWTAAGKRLSLCPSDIYSCRWMTCFDFAAEYGGDPDDYLDGCWDNGEDDAENPTHWMPLPEPPR